MLMNIKKKKYKSHNLIFRLKTSFRVDYVLTIILKTLALIKKLALKVLSFLNS